MRLRALASLVTLCLLMAYAAHGEEYVGAQACRSCHPAQYTQWRRTPHARAWLTLPADQRTTPECTVCHATSARHGFVGVQCESCHGPGGHYWPEFVMKDAELARAVGLERGDDPEICQRCHTADGPSLVPFDFKAALKQVAHPNPGPRR